MKISAAIKWLSAAGVVAGLALPSVGTFYALRLEYPNDKFILGLAITSWGLVGVALCLLLAGLVTGGMQFSRERKARTSSWAANGQTLRKYIDYLAAIEERETTAFVAMERDEQDFRNENPGAEFRLAENAERRLQQSEMMQARTNLAAAKTDFLKIAPRKVRREFIERWSRE